MFTAEEVKVLLVLPDDSKETGLRDKVLLSVMYATGARAQEICDLMVGKIQFTPTGASVNITGKDIASLKSFAFVFTQKSAPHTLL